MVELFNSLRQHCDDEYSAVCESVLIVDPHYGNYVADVREELRRYREDNSRHSEEVLEMWNCCMKCNIGKLGDERKS